MYLYDIAHQLAREIQQSEEYRSYKALKDEVFENEQTKTMLKQYKRLQFEAQAEVLAGRQPSSQTTEQLQKLGEVLAFQPKVTDYFAAEYKFQTIVSDIYNRKLSLLPGDSAHQG